VLQSCKAGFKVRLENYDMKKYIVFLSCLIFVNISMAGDQIVFRSLTNDEINKEFYETSKIDGKPGITERELEMKFGSGDSISKDSRWKGGNCHIYKLTDNRNMKVDILNGHIMLAIIENADGSDYLVWK
jgi:hypothetical protein